ncbi:hypothetical protein ANANG_G00200040 [Anguilla anguilla]|uniref:Uncharacterized protein n=1 Tax=Anguilla anguilla TaxID=7936 RepID=A0A9D3M2R9_ANGAN|nr:hypothetical protein ANANG_G00200040 [Anguilla anguilla]
MPISSGAAGRVGVGVNASITWSPEGWKQDPNLPPRNCDSYLVRYLETHPEARRRGNTDTSAVTCDHTSDQRPKGKNRTGFSKALNGETDAQRQQESQDGDATGTQCSGPTSNKSSMCAIL